MAYKSKPSLVGYLSHLEIGVCLIEKEIDVTNYRLYTITEDEYGTLTK